MKQRSEMRPRAQSGLRIHVLDALSGTEAEGLRVEVFRLGQRAEKRCSGRLGADGVLADAALCAVGLESGEYEIVFHLGEYYRVMGCGDAAPPCLQSVTLRLAIADSLSSCEMPLRIKPGGICMVSV